MTSKTITVPKTVIVNEPAIVLTLSKAEAQVLANFTAKIGGCPKTSSRVVADRLRVALADQDIHYQDSSEYNGGSWNALGTISCYDTFTE